MAAGKVNADLLIMGSSHAHVNVNPQDLAGVFPGWRIYNAGIDGYTFPVQLAQYRFYRRTNKAPRAILLCLDYMEFDRSAFRIDHFQFLPFTNDSSVRHALLAMHVAWPRVMIPFLKYRGEASTMMDALRPGASFPGESKMSLRPDGFMPVNESWQEEQFLSDTVRDHHRVLFDSSIWQAFQGFRQDCQKERITLITVFTPHYSLLVHKILEATEYRNWLRNHLEPATPFIDFSTAPFCADTALFYNATHLNAKGAEIFSRALADSLRKRGLGT